MYVRKRPKRFFIGGFTNEINEDKIYRYVNRRCLKVTKVKLFPSRRSADDVIIQLNVEDNMQCELLEQKGFWPPDIICNPWMTHSEALTGKLLRVLGVNQVPITRHILLKITIGTLT